MGRIYCDHAATTPVHPDVVAAMLDAVWGNPSSSHAEGRAARRQVEAARAQVAALIGADPAEIVFTSGGTEADNLAVNVPGHLVCSAVEHHAVLDACRAHGDVSVVPVDGQGRVDPDAVRSALRQDTVLVSVMLASNEVGTIQPVAEIAAICHAAGVLCHTDAVQAVGQIPVDVAELGVDLLTLSSHKIYGPKGVGALYVRRGTALAPLLRGGAQERRWRPGTENLVGIVGFGAAAELARRELPERAAHLARMRDRLFAAVSVGERTGHPTLRLPSIASYVFPGVDGQALLAALDLAGIAASGGSACTSGAPEPSHVLIAMGYGPAAATAVRLSFGTGTTAEQVDTVAAVLQAKVGRSRQPWPA